MVHLCAFLCTDGLPWIIGCTTACAVPSPPPLLGFCLALAAASSSCTSCGTSLARPWRFTSSALAFQKFWQPPMCSCMATCSPGRTLAGSRAAASSCRETGGSAGCCGQGRWPGTCLEQPAAYNRPWGRMFKFLALLALPALHWAGPRLQSVVYVVDEVVQTQRAVMHQSQRLALQLWRELRRPSPTLAQSAAFVLMPAPAAGRAPKQRTFLARAWPLSSSRRASS